MYDVSVDLKFVRYTLIKSLSFLKQLSCIFAVALTLCGVASVAQATPNVPAADEDTILIDRQPSNKTPYSKIVRAVIYKIFEVDSEKIMSFGADAKRDVVRRFADYADRTRTKFKVKEDSVELEFKVHF